MIISDIAWFVRQPSCSHLIIMGFSRSEFIWLILVSWSAASIINSIYKHFCDIDLFTLAFKNNCFDFFLSWLACYSRSLTISIDSIASLLNILFENICFIIVGVTVFKCAFGTNFTNLQIPKSSFTYIEIMYKYK